MMKCRCSKMGSLDSGINNIVLKNYNGVYSGANLVEYTCIQCGCVKKDSENIKAKYSLNISDFKFPKELILIEFKIVNEIFEEICISPSAYDMFFILRIIINLFSNTNIKIIRKYRFFDIRKQIIYMMLERTCNSYNEKLLKNFIKELFCTLDKNCERIDFNSLTNIELNYENLKLYGPLIYTLF